MFICRDMLHIPQIVWAGPDQPSKVTTISTFWNAQASEVNYLQIFFSFFFVWILLHALLQNSPMVSRPLANCIFHWILQVLDKSR